MARNSFATGANMRGFVDIYANNVSLVETNQIKSIILKIFSLIIQGLKLPMKKIIIMKLILVILMFLDCQV